MELLMTMLPSQSQQQLMAHLTIGVISPNQQRAEQLLRLLARKSGPNHANSAAVENVTLKNLGEVGLSAISEFVTLISVQSHTDWEPLLDGLDGVILIIDGDVGLDRTSQSLWAYASDIDLPRLVVTPDSARTRADFDEVVAIVQRVLEPDALIRFLPISDEESTDYVALFDLLSNDIRTYNQLSQVSSLAPDAEHLDLTNDQREDFIDELVHIILDDVALSNYNAGLPLNFARLRDDWNCDEIVSVLPVSELLGIDLVHEWINSRAVRVVPVVMGADEFPTLSGVAIHPHVLRMWGSNAERGVGFELVTVDTQSPVVTAIVVPGIVIVQAEQSIGASVSTPKDTSYLVLPELS